MLCDSVMCVGPRVILKVARRVSPPIRPGPLGVKHFSCRLKFHSAHSVSLCEDLCHSYGRVDEGDEAASLPMQSTVGVIASQGEGTPAVSFASGSHLQG
jgi:hypothetical protein